MLEKVRIGRDWDLAEMWATVADTRNMLQLGSREDVTLTMGQGQHVRISQALSRIVIIISISVHYLRILVSLN